MSKSILVIDTPESCCQCRFSGSDGDYCCLKENMVSDSNMISEEEYLNKKPDWCPLRELKKKKDMDFREKCSMYISRYWEGYNALIDEILKGENGNEV